MKERDILEGLRVRSKTLILTHENVEYIHLVHIRDQWYVLVKS
jgi:hypothetical protein